MSQDIRREIIGKNLGIKPINHGQVYAFQIAIPDSRKVAISLEQRQALERSLLSHQSNLISLIIRRTDAYDDDDIEYELVYGADWLQIAQELDVEKVWAWVFDMTDEQAEAAIAEMEFLTGAAANKGASEAISGSSSAPDSDIAALIDQKLQLATDSIKNSIAPLLNGIRSDLEEKLKVLNYKFETLSPATHTSDGLGAVLDKLDAIQRQLETPARRASGIAPIKDEDRINLLVASDRDIENALKQVNTQSKQITAAIQAVHYWKQSEQGLNWQNLGRSARANKNSQEKIKDFAEGTFERLRAVAEIPEEDQEE